MKYFQITMGLLLLSMASISQNSEDSDWRKNIVPNSSFEKYSGTPIGWFYKGEHFTKVMRFWDSPTSASPDVFGPKVRVPKHWADKGFGDQAPKDGKSMIGLTSYGCKDGKPHCREYVQIQLAEPLVIGQIYYMEIWVSHLPRSLQINNIGATFSPKHIKVSRDLRLNLLPLIRSKKVISAPNHKWKKLSGRFTADVEGNYLIIGNFYPDSLTQVKDPGGNSLNYAYYYIDKVYLRKEPPILKPPVAVDDLKKIKLEEGKIVVLKNIFFDFDKSDLLPRSFIELGKLIEIMEVNSNMEIEIRGHCDSRGSKEYNDFLSTNRAEAVYNYLIENGIQKNRCIFKGYGSEKPIATNDTEIGRQKNRRVEFKILKK